MKKVGTSANSVFAVRFANPNTYGTSQTSKTLGEMASKKDDKNGTERL